jgi:hypothetical protein
MERLHARHFAGRSDPISVGQVENRRGERLELLAA